MKRPQVRCPQCKETHKAFPNRCWSIVENENAVLIIGNIAGREKQTTEWAVQTEEMWERMNAYVKRFTNRPVYYRETPLT